jgi:hypothetical protein
LEVKKDMFLRSACDTKGKELAAHTIYLLSM